VSIKPILGLLIFATFIAAQEAAPGAGLIQGSVVDSVTGSGIAGVTVYFGQNEGASYETTTDAAGAFRIANLQPGVYGSHFEKSGYVPRFSGATGSALRPVTIDSNQDPLDLRVELVKLATLRGRVLDPEGKPAVNATVEAGATREIVDQDGSFSFTGLIPGTYTLRATASDKTARPPDTHSADPRIEVVPTWFPSGLSMDDAEKIEAGGGAELSGFEIHLRSTPVYRVRGAVVDDNGKPIAGATVSLAELSTHQALSLSTTPQGPMGFFAVGGPSLYMDGAIAETAPDGSFEFPSVRTGTWQFLMQKAAIGERPSMAGTSAVVDRDTDDLKIRASSMFTLKYSVEREGATDTPPSLAAAPRLFNEEIPGMLLSAFGWTTDGTQVISIGMPGRYQIMPPPGLPGGYYLSSLALGSQQILGQSVYLVPGSPPIKAVYKPNAGIVHGACGAAQFVLVLDTALAPATRSYGRAIQCAEGAYNLESLIPGDYYLWALDRGLDSLKASDAGILRRLSPNAARVHVEEGSITSLDLTVTHLPETN
jgi:protocatechuate 3,4-dioxygenase beta subunit